MIFSHDEIKEAIVEWAAKKGIETRAEDISFEAEEYVDDDNEDEHWTEVEATAHDIKIISSSGGPYR